MNRLVVKSIVSGDGHVHLDIPVGPDEVGVQVQVTVEPLAAESKRTLTAAELLHSGLVGMWAARTDVGDSLAFARRLREEAQTRRQDP
jgi:hypothetical protein